MRQLGFGRDTAELGDIASQIASGDPVSVHQCASRICCKCRQHQRPSFLEYGEYPYVTADEIKKALNVKSALSEMLDQMQ